MAGVAYVVREMTGGIIRKNGPDGQHTANAINESTNSTKQPLYSPLSNKNTDIVNNRSLAPRSLAPRSLAPRWRAPAGPRASKR